MKLYVFVVIKRHNVNIIQSYNTRVCVCRFSG